MELTGSRTGDGQLREEERVRKSGGDSDSTAHPSVAPPLPSTHGPVTAHPAGDRHWAYALTWGPGPRRGLSPGRGQRSLTEEPLHGSHSLAVLHHLREDLQLLCARQGPCRHRLGTQALGHAVGGAGGAGGAGCREELVSHTQTQLSLPRRQRGPAHTLTLDLQLPGL